MPTAVEEGFFCFPSKVIGMEESYMELALFSDVNGVILNPKHYTSPSLLIRLFEEAVSPLCVFYVGRQNIIYSSTVIV